MMTSFGLKKYINGTKKITQSHLNFFSYNFLRYIRSNFQEQKQWKRRIQVGILEILDTIVILVWRINYRQNFHRKRRVKIALPPRNANVKSIL